MNYKVIKGFFDVQDNNHDYSPGDMFPREGYKPSESRIESLLSSNNAGNCPFIAVVEEEKEEKETKVTSKGKNKK